MDLEKLEKLNELKEKGILTQEEFEQKKKELLNESGNNKEAKTEALSGGVADFSHLGIIKGSFNAFLSSFKRWNDFKGRTSRFDFWGSWFMFCIFSSGIDVISEFSSPAVKLLNLPFLYILITMLIRRLHDTNKSGWWILTIFAPIMYMFFKGDTEANRFGPAFITNEKKATNTLLSLIAFNIIFALFLMPLFVAFGKGFSSGFSTAFKSTQTIDQVKTMATNVHTLFGSQRDYKGVENPSMMYSLGVFTDDICKNEKCTNPTNPYGGSISIKSEGKLFIITYSGLPQTDCVKIASANWAETPTFTLLAINAQNGLSKQNAFETNISEQTAQKACSSETNAITWAYK